MDRDARHMSLGKLYSEMRKKDPLRQPVVAQSPEERKARLAARQEALRERIRQDIGERMERR